jgi:hypothetical protein
MLSLEFAPSRSAYAHRVAVDGQRPAPSAQRPVAPERNQKHAATHGGRSGVVLREGQLIAENTDGQEFLTALRGVTDPLGQRLVVFDAGGAARTIAVERPRLPAQLR